jgi:hypothetical protein
MSKLLVKQLFQKQRSIWEVNFTRDLEKHCENVECIERALNYI